jgi:peroxiredoxin
LSENDMTGKRWRFIVPGAVAALLCGLTLARAASESPAVPAPDFSLKSTAGQNLRLKEFRGEVVMLNFWATWCGPCREEMPILNRLHEQYRKTGFVVLGVNIDDDAGKAADMARRLKVSYPILHDAQKQVGKLYRVNSMPTTVLIDRDGKLRYTHRGFHSDYERIYQEQVRQLLKQ